MNSRLSLNFFLMFNMSYYDKLNIIAHYIYINFDLTILRLYSFYIRPCLVYRVRKK
jgi:hypothetical protein